MRNTHKYSSDIIYHPSTVIAWAVRELNISQENIAQNYSAILGAYEKWLIAKEAEEELNDTNALKRVKKNQFQPREKKVPFRESEYIGRFYGVIFNLHTYDEKTDLYKWSLTLRWGYIEKYLWGFTTEDYTMTEDAEKEMIKMVKNDFRRYIEQFDEDLRILKQYEYNNVEPDYNIIEI